jgi:hypothetical protein
VSGGRAHVARTYDAYFLAHDFLSGQNKIKIKGESKIKVKRFTTEGTEDHRGIRILKPL